MEFDVLWRLFGRDRLPYPMAYRSSAESADAEQRARGGAAQSLRSGVDGTLQGAMSALLEPELRVEVCAFTGAGLTSVTRVHAGLRGGSAVVVRQLPGADVDSGGDVRIAVVPRTRVSNAVIAALPSADRGTGRRLVAEPERGNGSLMRPVAGRGTPDDVRAFFAQRRLGIGEIGVHPGPAVDWRPTDDGGVFQWIDVADGRYLVNRADDVVEVLPAGAAELGSQLATLVDRVGRKSQASSTSHTAR
ncbi:ESX secretion-associated protein EspG [Rhodococcus gannanensis]|uniref:ESX secretion-associated protein EspG n=1 Tax=Rhodococcus gannanensis TaxID=1960308 RepID=A0ABW4P0W0_9NOCA